MKDVMLDLETLGTDHDAAIISIGACYFDRKTGEIGARISINVDPTEFIKELSVSYGTIAWWFLQSDRARELSLQNAAPLNVALTELKEFLVAGGDITLWSHATFDMPILAHAFKVCGIVHPVPFRNMRDIRTVMDVAGPSAPMTRDGTHHHAIDDALYQAKYVTMAIRTINGKI